ncbi:MAG TPA: hypothetical protein VF669_07245, partial [Tepidisphaeraceae bacterium]
KLLSEAKVNGLRAAAAASGLPVITTGQLVNRPGAQIPNYNLPEEVRTDFLKGAFDLLATPPAHPNAQPIRVVELAPIARLDVTELATVTPMWSNDTRYLAAEQAATEAMTPLLRQFLFTWFDYNNVVARLDYRATDVDQTHDTAPAPVEPPIF